MDSPLRLDAKRALITGGSSGIGLATAKLLAARGAAVHLVARDEQALRDAADGIRSSGGAASYSTADVTDPDALEAAAAACTEEYGGIDLVFANAGTNGVWAPIDQLGYDEFATTVRVDVLGTFNTIKACAPHLKAAGGGSVVVTSSINGNRTFSNTGATAYASSKAAQMAMAKLLAVEFAPHGIRVNVVCPGTVDTEIEERMERRGLDGAGWPVEYPKGKVPITGGGPGDPERVAEVVAFLFSDLAAHVTGTELYVDGAQSLIMG